MKIKHLALAAASAAVLSLALAPAGASAKAPKAPKPLPGAARQLEPGGTPYRAPAKVGGTWTKVAAKFPGTNGPDTPLLLTDGTVLVHDLCSTNWYKLTPDANGSYANGTWSNTSPMPDGYTPLYFASQVLADGRVVVNGGEYINCSPVWSNDGAIYDPVADKWTRVAAPKGWDNIGDAQSIVLPNGGYMLANAVTPDESIATFGTGTNPHWKTTGKGKQGRNDEEGWNFIPFNQILTVDANRNLGGDHNSTELYDIATGKWKDGPDTPNVLVDPNSEEIGPAILIPNGPLFQVGGTPCDSSCPGHTALYDAVSNSWTAGPDIPKVSKKSGDSSDGPGALLPNGNVLIQTSAIFAAPSHFFEFDGTKLNRVSEPADAPNMSSYEGRMLVLPTGEIFWTSDLGDIEIYKTSYATNPDWAPTIASAPKTVSRGSAGYQISGTRFNGLTQGAGYGDDAQSYTNFPIVRITNSASGHVCYARTHDHSTMGINAPEDPTSTTFDVPASCEAGKSKLEVVANGMASPAIKVTVK